MPKKESGDDALRCSFCNKSQREVKKLIAGPTVFICDECVDICLDIIAEDRLLEQQQLEHLAIIVYRHSPLLIVIADIERLAEIHPGAALR